MVYDYSLWQWVLVFYLYCFLGWCFESTVVSVQQRHFVNRGFLRGPMLPIYGFGATQYEKDGTECWIEAQARMRSAVQKAILSQYVYDFVDYLNVDTAFGKVTYKYMLLPVYIGHSKYNGKLYHFYVNGQNGNVAGKSPVSPVKVLFTVLIGLAALAGIGVLLYFLLR